MLFTAYLILVYDIDLYTQKDIQNQKIFLNSLKIRNNFSRKKIPIFGEYFVLTQNLTWLSHCRIFGVVFDDFKSFYAEVCFMNNEK